MTFPNPIPQLTTYHDKLNLRFGGIRKPRLGNSGLIDMANAKGWGLTGNVGGNGGENALLTACAALTKIPCPLECPLEYFVLDCNLAT